MSDIFDCRDDAQLLPGMRQARQAIGRGALVVIPTDTVYGVAADAFNAAAVQRLLDAKGRTRESPPPVLVAGTAMVRALVADLPEPVERLIEKFWPGGLTIVLPAQPSLTWDLGETRGTVAVRMPDHRIALELIEETGPLAVSSANLTGEAAAVDVLSAHQMLGDRIDVYLDSGPVATGVPSTILDATGLARREPGTARILRIGAVSADEIHEVIGDLLEAPAAPVETDADGQWAVGVPERNADYTVTLNEDTLPEGIAVIDETGEDTSPNVREVTVGPGGRVTTNFFIGEGERNTTGFVDQLVERLVNGVNFGLMLALAAIGLSLVYGTTGISNFAHGEMVTFGALIALLFAVGLSLPLLVAVPLAVIVSGAFGYAMDAGLWRPLRRRGLGVVQLMIVSIGLSLALRYIFQMFVGGGTLQLPNPLSGVIPLPGSIVLTWMDLVSMLISVVVIIIFALWLTRSRIGRATRAVSDNPSLAAASGIDVDGIVRIVWILAAALAGLSGVLWAYFRPGIKWDMGTSILLLLFAAVVLGGLGTALGALVGSLIVGILVETTSLFGVPDDLKYVGALVVLILILLFRPQGILGRKERVG